MSGKGVHKVRNAGKFVLSGITKWIWIQKLSEKLSSQSISSVSVLQYPQGKLTTRRLSSGSCNNKYRISTCHASKLCSRKEIVNSFTISYLKAFWVHFLKPGTTKVNRAQVMFRWQQERNTVNKNCNGLRLGVWLCYRRKFCGVIYYLPALPVFLGNLFHFSICFCLHIWESYITITQKGLTC